MSGLKDHFNDDSVVLCICLISTLFKITPLVTIARKNLFASLQLSFSVAAQTQGRCWTSDDPVHKSLSWVCSVWHQLNACLSRLGTSEALLGPYIFLSCPVNAEQTQAIPKYLNLVLSRYWNF